MSDTATWIADLAAVAAVPPDGILSRILYKDGTLNVTLFAFDAGQELTEHTAAGPAILQVLDGTARITAGGSTYTAGPGAWLHLPARLPHSVAAQTPLRLLLTLLRDQGSGVRDPGRDPRAAGESDPGAAVPNPLPHLREIPDPRL